MEGENPRPSDSSLPRLSHAAAGLPAPLPRPAPAPSAAVRFAASKLYTLSTISQTTNLVFDYPCLNLLSSSWNLQ